MSIKEQQDLKLSLFTEWLKKNYRKSNGQSLSDQTIISYTGALKSIDKDIQKKSLIKQSSIFGIDEIAVIEKLRNDYFSIEEFIEKNKIGNNRHSVAFQHYIDFIKSQKTSKKSDDSIRTASQKKYWLFAPGENANMWEEFYQNGIMALGWDELGDLKNYQTQEEVAVKLREIENSDGSKVNNAKANFQFPNDVSIGDVIIVKKGRKKLLGYGEVTSDYYFDDEKAQYKSCRKVDWKKKGNWKTDHFLAIKTLTDISDYPSDHPDYDQYHKRLFMLMGEKKVKENSTMKYPLNTILYGPPGTGKTYNTVLRAAQIIENRTITDYGEALNIFNQHLGERIEFITFHQNYSYEDFIEGLRPDVDSGANLSFERKDGVFKRIADKALKNIQNSERPIDAKRPFDKVFFDLINPLVEGENEEIEIPMKKVSFFITGVTDKSIEFRKNEGDSNHSLSIGTLRKMYERGENDLIIGGLQPYYNPLLKKLLEKGKTNVKAIKKQNYVIIIDEINRANISRVFGELITLIEPDKRSHGAIPLKCTLPSGENFMVPSNLYIIGTMNTADKSIALLDIALRRRFEFEPMYPLYEIENEIVNDTHILKKINEEIIKGKGHDFQIGHAYFMGKDFNLNECMNKKVIPLLLEYYMNDTKEVKKILDAAGLDVDNISYPMKIRGTK